MEGLENPEEQEALELQRYRSLMKKAAVAGAFGTFLMLAEHLAWLPDMNSPDSRWIWSELALITLGIMIYSGIHFYQRRRQSVEFRASQYGYSDCLRYRCCLVVFLYCH